MLLLPNERDLSPAMVGLRIICRDAAMRAGRPYALIGQEPAGPRTLPWWVWVAVGGVVLGAARLVMTRRGERDEPAYVMVDRSVELPPVGEAELHPFSPDEELLRAFERDADESMLALWKGL